MDTATYIIILAFFVSIGAGLFLNFFKEGKMWSHKNLFIIFGIVWASMTFFGECIYAWAGNATCSKYLGCVAGFSGYDAFEHLFCGIAGALLIFWLCERFPNYSLLHKEWWKNLLIIVSLFVLASVAWEIFECLHDAIRVDILHESLRNFSLHINYLDQPTNLDTMGDLSFGFLGAIIGFLL